MKIKDLEEFSREFINFRRTNGNVKLEPSEIILFDILQELKELNKILRVKK